MQVPTFKSEKTELLPMYPRIPKALSFDVPLNAFFIAMLLSRSTRRSKTLRPKASPLFPDTAEIFPAPLCS